jgi:hypothetical protein
MPSMIIWKHSVWVGLLYLLHGFKLPDKVLTPLVTFCLRQSPKRAICVMSMGERLVWRGSTVPLRSFPVPLFAVTLLAIVIFSAAFTAQAASFPENQCAADRYGSDLNCNANDVSITGMAVVGDTTSCVGGANVTLDLQMTINFAVPDRYDIGIFISNDGKTPQTKAANGGAASCTVSVLPTASPFLDLDGGATGDICGDGDKTIGGGTGSGIHYMSNVTVPCQSLNGAGGNLYIPFVVSWDNQKTPPGEVCTSNLNPVPGTSSKCNSPTVTQGSVAVVVLPSITMTDNKTTLSSGDSTSYIVTITNTTGVSLSGVVFQDPAVTGIVANSLSCSASGGASCPVSTVNAMQGAGITIPTMPVGSSVTYTINATLTGNQSDSRTNTASASVGSQSNSASDTDIIVGAIAILPSTQSQNGAKGTSVVYNYTVYNYGASADTISLSALSNKSWTVGLSSSSVSVPAGGAHDITLTVNIPNNASVGTVDTTTITAVSGNNPSKTATATAVTTVTTILTLTPNNASAGGAGSYVYYNHRVQSNASTSKAVSLAPSFTSGSCTGWTSALYEPDKTTALSSPVTLSAYGGYKDFVLKVNIPFGATISSTCTATLTAAYTSGAANTVSVTDITTVKNLVLYEDPGYTTEQDTYPAGNNVYAKTYGLTNGTPYYYKWYDPSGTLVRTSPVTSNLVTLPDTYSIPNTGPLGTWVVQVWNNTTNTLFEQANFYVGPDHLKASYGGINPNSNSNVVIDLALHDKVNHVVPFDSLGNLVKGSPTDPEGPLMVTITVSGSAEIVSTTLTNATITGQSVTGKLDSTSGTATLTITDSVAEAVTITPVSYKSALYGSPVRDEPNQVTFLFVPLLDHIQIEHTGTGLTCMPSDVTIKACADAACSSLATGSATVTLLPDLGWAANPVTFTGSTTASLSITSPQTVILGTSAVSPVSYGATRCFIGGTESCDLTFADAGFIFSGASGGTALTIPTQVAGVDSGTYYLRAVKKNTSTQACEAGLEGANSVKFAYECNDPATCSAGNLMSVNGSSVAANGNGSVISYSAVGMTFDTNGNAPFTLNYSDVGLVKLWVNTTVNSATLTGSSNAFVVKPAGFVLSDIKQTAAPQLLNPAATNASGSKFVKAGEAFSATVTAVNSLGNATPNYGQEATPESVKLTSALVTGLGLSINPALTYTSGFGAFSNGSATGTDFSWNEVGIITLKPSVLDGDYLGVGDVIEESSNNVGRFIPHHFALTGGALTNRSDINSGAGCTPASSFTYMGEPMKVGFTLTAKNASGDTTENYTGSFAKFSAPVWTAYNANDSVGLWAVAEDFAYGGNSCDVVFDNLTPSVNSLASCSPATPALTIGRAAGPRVTVSSSSLSAWNSGVATFSTDVRLERGDAPDGPYEKLKVGVAPQDLDGVKLQATAFDLDADNNATNERTLLGTTQVLFGRLNIQNAYGSELLDLPMSLTAQLWDSMGWATNESDGCTALVAPTDGNGLTLNLANGGTTATSLISPLLSGDAGLSLSAPGATHTGYVDIAIDSPAWLDFKWDGVNESNPTSRATFGIFKGNSKFIYIRELYY